MYRTRNRRLKHLSAVAALTALATAWVGIVVMFATGAIGPGLHWGGGMMGFRGIPGSCRPSATSGQYIRYTAVDAGGMMGGAMYRLLPLQATIRSGAVTIDLLNEGTRPHELLVFPLRADDVPGTRFVDTNDRVGEEGIIGEVSPLCAQAEDVDGIAAGNAGRVSLTLDPGRYEIVCNLPGHYRVGMWAVLNVE